MAGSARDEAFGVADGASSLAAPSSGRGASGPRSAPEPSRIVGNCVRRGGVPVDGLGMLLHQAVPGFARWFGVTPAVTPVLRAKLEADILGH